MQKNEESVMKKMMRFFSAAMVIAAGLMMQQGRAQGAPAVPTVLTAPGPVVADSTNAVDYFAAGGLAAMQPEILAKAQANASGNAGILLAHYPNHYMNLNVRVKPGGAELHTHWNDIFVVLDGEATEVTGGTIPGMTMDAKGEGHGAMVVGGAEQKLHKGDVLHIAAGTPHQTVLEPGKTFTYFVIKVAKE
jgi:mannose-6-phosphate isomerase-like protein (cupin superfamily)